MQQQQQQLHLHNNNNLTTLCEMPLSFWSARDEAYFITYHILTPIFFVAGFIGHSLCIAVFVRQARKHGSYAYQIYVEFSGTGELLSFALYTLTIKWWSGAETTTTSAQGGVAWYTNSYPLMWFAARLSTPLVNMFITTSLLLSLVTALDRARALWKPYSYYGSTASCNLRSCTLRHTMHFRNRLGPGRKTPILAACFCAFLGVITTLFALLRYRIIKIENDNVTDQKYEIYIDEIYASSIVTRILSNLRDALRTLALIALICTNCLVVLLYRKTVTKKLMASSSLLLSASLPSDSDKSTTDRRRLRRRRKIEHSLTVLAVIESTTTALGMFALTSYFVIIFSRPAFTSCGGLLMIPIVDAIVQLSNVAKFYLSMALDVRFRRTILKVLIKCFKTGYHWRWRGAGNCYIEPAPLTVTSSSINATGAEIDYLNLSNNNNNNDNDNRDRNL